MMLLAAILLAPVFTDHAVLQQGKPVPVWGTAAPGEKVVVSFAGQKVSALADAKGDWVAYLDALAANSTGADLTAGSVVMRDVLVGEVWLASGQSNMEFVVDDPHGKVYHVDNAAEEVAAARYPLIRHFKVGHQVGTTPLAGAKGEWKLCSPETVREFSAVAYFYSRELFRRLQVPIGVINASWGGTPVEAWMSPMALAQHPLPHPHPSPGHPRDNWTVTGLYNGMINPVVPYAIRGAIWYQGESNADLAEDYHPLFAGMITAWRDHFGQGDFPFYWAQLANFTVKTDASGMSYAELRGQQTLALSLPQTGQAVTIDIGDPANIHPHNKQEVGRRLALIAKAKVYGIPGDYSGPVFERAAVEGGAVRVYFRYADNGLIAAAKPAQAFEVAGKDGRFWPAVVTLRGATALARSASVPHPVAVRYAWGNAPEANLYNGAGLPAVAFWASVKE